MNFKKNESEKKLRGAYYTNPEIAHFLTRWVFEIGPKRVLEPGCGDGIFFEAMGHIPNIHLEQVVGFEIEKAEAAKARERASQLLRCETLVNGRDFLEWSYRNFFSGPHFDAVLGNPPYIRYQYLDKRLQEIAGNIFNYHRLPFTKHTNIWVTFVVSSLALLRPKGRLAMVLPEELLHVLHAQSLRDYLAEECERILIIDPKELWFDGALQGAIFLMAEKKDSRSASSKGLAIIQTNSKGILKSDVTRLFATTEYINGKTLSGKWTKALLTNNERCVLEDVYERNGIFRFDTIADVDVGIVTGANKFFLVTDDIVQRYRLKNWAYPMFGRSEHVAGVIYGRLSHSLNKRKGFPTNFLWFTGEPKTKLPKLVREYIEAGEKAGLNERYKCKVRNPWYSVPSVYVSPVGMLKRSHDFPRLILNQARAFTTDTAYRIMPKGVSSERLVYSFVNSLTMLSAELEGRHYGGGVLELVPSEIEKLRLPLPNRSKINLKQLHRAFMAGKRPEEILHSQDKQLLSPLGLEIPQIGTIYEAWNRLRLRRQRLLADL